MTPQRCGRCPAPLQAECGSGLLLLCRLGVPPQHGLRNGIQPRSGGGGGAPRSPGT